MQLLAVVSVVAVCLGWCQANKVDVHDCGSDLGIVLQVDITPCPSLPCPFHRGSFVNMTITFTTKKDITEAQTKVYGVIDGAKVTYDLPDDNACHFMSCPIKTGETVSYVNGLPVGKMYPSIKLVVEWTLVDQSSGSNILCFTYPVQITEL